MWYSDWASLFRLFSKQVNSLFFREGWTLFPRASPSVIRIRATAVSSSYNVKHLVKFLSVFVAMHEHSFSFIK